MKPSTLFVIGLLLGLPALRQASAVTAPAGGNPFQVIVERNLFGLKPPPPPPAPPETKAPPSKIKLLGTANVFGTKKVILQVVEPPKPGQPAAQAQDLPFTLAEGESEHDVEVQAIDEQAGSVKIVNHGVATTLTLEKDGVKLAAGPAPGIPPAMPGLVPGAPQPMPMVQPLPRPNFGAPAPFFATPPASPKAATLGNPDMPAANVAGAMNVGYQGNAVNSFPARPVRTDTSQIDPAQQVALIELNRAATQDLVRQGQMPPLPPTDFTPPQNPSAQPPGSLHSPPGLPIPRP